MKPIIWQDLQTEEYYQRQSEWYINTEGTFAKFETKEGEKIIHSVLDVKPADFERGEEVWVHITGRWQIATVKDRRKQGPNLLYVVENESYWNHVVTWHFDPKTTEIKKKMNWHGYILRGDHKYTDEKVAHSVEELHAWYKQHDSFADPATELVITPIQDHTAPMDVSAMSMKQSEDAYESLHQPV